MNCRVCGRQFDPQGFQVMVPGVPHGFDRVDCALEALAVGLPPQRAAEPLPEAAKALPPPPLAPVPALAVGPAPSAAAGRPNLLAGVNLALLAGATAATIYLWLRVFGADAGPISLPSPNASAAFARTTVPAAIDLSPAAEARPQPESAVRGGGSQPATTAPVPAFGADEGGATLVSNPTAAKKKSSAQRNGGAVARPVPPGPAPTPEPAPPPEPGPSRSAPTPTFPVPSAPPGDRVPGPTLPGGGTSPEQPRQPGSGTRG